MPSKTEHLRAAQENVAAFWHLDAAGNAFPQGMATTVFYTAVHVVEAVFDDREGVHSESHADRNDRLRRERTYRQIWRHFRPLYRESLIARYLADDGPPVVYSDHLSASGVKRTLLRHHLKQIAASAGRLTGETIDLEPPDTAAP